MTAAQFTPESPLRSYLNGRSVPQIFCDAVVWAIEARVISNETPTLDETLSIDIDDHAVALPERPIVCALLRRLDEFEVTTHAIARHPGHREFGTSVY